ncbi:uncharacterized protein F5891DRAFT_984046 [Suillus fuscotomentosus]|uniref:Uncharacterized protein n=1 Tax=Suillus fuscotomentosus TaxID=1912939 RepID=A0AAD4DZZ2_9AGAM|nr:uncharacterized protein F5891DRAFT_984046 [Suillus fuscotomentosus]KAG1895743.1 hypothetical protein F5891DRAFT_984046 [Suillus fuscotomentosus]
MHMAERNDVLVTIGEESAIWDLGKTDKRNQAPVLLKSSKVQPSNKPHPVSCFALSSALSFLAIGLADGTVLLYRHLDQPMSSTTSLTTLPNTRIIHESSPESITGLGFREFSGPTNADAKDNNLHLFIVTTNSVYLYHVSGKGGRVSSVLLDDIGCGLGYVVMDWRAENIVLVRDEEVYTYGLQGRELPYGYEARVAGGDGDASRVTAFDMENKDIREVISEWGNICILTNNGQNCALLFNPTSLPLQTLHAVRKGSIPTCTESRADTTPWRELRDIHRQHGDNLYTKGDCDGAMTYYLKAIDWLKPSYVVRKHSSTTLLLNTYTKPRDVARLDSFIKTESRRSGAAESNGDLPFDLDCRQAVYFTHASYLAKRYKRHEEYLRVMVEDAGEYEEALTYLRHLGAAASSTPANAPSYLALSRAPAPEDKVEESKADKEDLTGPQTTQPSAPTPSKEKLPSPTLYFAHFVDHPSYFVRFLASVAARWWGQSLLFLSNTSSDNNEDLGKHNQAAVWNTLLELYLDGGSPEQQEKALKSSYSYTRGLVILWEKLGMFEDILRFWMDKHNANLPRQQSTPELLTRHQADVEKILEHIEKERIIPPLGVVQILSRNGVASVGLVKDWLMGHIKEAKEEVQTVQQLISSYRLEANAKLKQVAELEGPMHAKGSLLDHEIECPLCVRQHGIIQEIRGNHEIKHELFLADVQDNGFKAVAAGFGKGVLNMTRLDDNRYCAVPYFYHMICIYYGIQ